MARPRAYKMDDVLQAAMTVFWRQGFVATSMADLYGATGLKPGNLYATFTDKDGIFRAAFDAYVVYFRATLPAHLQGRAAIVEWLRIQADLATEDKDRKGCLIVLTITERQSHTPAMRAVAHARIDEINAFFVDQITIALERDEIAKPRDGAALAAALTGAVVAIMTLARGGATDAMIRAIAEQAVAQLGKVPM